MCWLHWSAFNHSNLEDIVDLITYSISESLCYNTSSLQSWVTLCSFPADDCFVIFLWIPHYKRTDTTSEDGPELLPYALHSVSTDDEHLCHVIRQHFAGVADIYRSLCVRERKKGNWSETWTCRDKWSQKERSDRKLKLSQTLNKHFSQMWEKWQYLFVTHKYGRINFIVILASRI